MGYPHFSGDCDHSKCLTGTDIQRQLEWSAETFGPSVRRGVIDHIKKELKEVEESGLTDVEEWIDIMILAIDGAWRGGGTPQQIIKAYKEKMERNFQREWPDWRGLPTDKAIEHTKEQK